MKSAAVVLALLRFAMAYPNDCPNVTVLHSVLKDGWNAGCLGLDYSKAETTALACKKSCYADVNCSIWQWVAGANNDGGDNDVYKCWQGHDVHGCAERGGGQKQEQFAGLLKDGERIQHGEVKVLSNNSEVFYKGLKKYPEDTGNVSEKIARCKLSCYTTITCSIWQFNKDGCTHEDESNPADKANPVKTGDVATTMLNGQTIEHYCPFWVPPAEEEGLPWPWIITGIVLGLLALAAIVYSLQKKPKVKKTRAVKITPKPEEPEEPEPVRTVYFIPQPTVLVPQMQPQYAPIAAGPIIY